MKRFITHIALLSCVPLIVQVLKSSLKRVRVLDLLPQYSRFSDMDFSNISYNRRLIWNVLVFSSMYCVNQLYSQVAALPSSHSGPFVTASLPTGWSESGIANQTTLDGGAGSSAALNSNGEYLTINLGCNDISSISYYLRKTSAWNGTAKIRISTDNVDWSTVATLNPPEVATLYTTDIVGAPRYVQFFVENLTDGRIELDGITVSGQTNSCTSILTHNFNSSGHSWVVAGSNSGGDWVRGTSFSGNTTNHMYFSPYNNYGSEDAAHITTPTVDLSSYESMSLSLSVRYKTESAWDGMNIYYSTDNGTTWTILGANGQGTNWYNDTGVDGINDRYAEISSDPHGWSGDNSSWQTASINLPSIINNKSQVKFRVYFGADGSNVDDGVAFDDFTISGITSCSDPSSQATSFTYSNVACTSMTLGWTRGNGSKVLVIAKEGSAPSDPSDGTGSYTASATYGSGSSVGGGYVVYDGTGTSVALTGLTANTTYHFAAYEYNTTGTCYNETQLTGNKTTLSAATVTTTSATSISSTSASSGGSSITAGGGTISAKGVCYATAATSTNPTTSNSTTSDGTGTSNYTSTLSSLTAETRYYYKAYVTNECGTSYGSVADFWTLSAEPTGHAASFTATAVSPSQIDLAFTAASTYGADGYIILMYQGASAPTSAGVTDAVAPASLSGFSPAGATLLVTVTSNSQTTYSHTTCSSLTQYYYTLIPYNWNAVNAETYNYRTSATIPTATATTPTGPSAEGYYISGNIVNNGTINNTNDINYLRMTGSSKSISGTGTWTSVKLCVNGSISFGGSGLTSVVNAGSTITQLFVLSNSFTLYNNQTFPVTNVTNYATITTNSDSDLQVSGTWLNTSAGTQSLSSGKVTFNGTGDQSVTSAGDSFGSITMNNTSSSGTYDGIVLQDAMSVAGTITFTDGNIGLGTYDLTMGSAANVSGQSTSTGWVITNSTGVMKYTSLSTTAKTFPIGISKASYTPMSLSNASSADFTARVSQDVLANGTSGSTDNNGKVKRTWNITNTSGTPNATVTLSWTTAEEDANFIRGNSYVTHYGSSWDQYTGSSASLSGNLYSSTRTGVTSFSPFAVKATSALPIELTSFQANCSDQNTVEVTWTTASEYNTNYFRVDKSRNGTQWDVLGTIGAAGNSTYTIDYALSDAFPNPGINYYRLTQYDLDGVFETFDAQAAVCKDQQAGTALSSYPNPSTSDFNVDLQTDELEGEGVLMITDAKGAVVHSQDIKIIKGNNNYVIQKFNAEPGIYYISVKAGASTVTTKHSLR